MHMSKLKSDKLLKVVRMFVNIVCCVLQKLREQVIIMKEYFLQCAEALRSKLLVQVMDSHR